MIRIVGAVFTCFLTFAMTASVARCEPLGQQLQRYSHKELRSLAKNARNVTDYQILAAYFHHQKQIYRAKAEAEMEKYLHSRSRISPSFKFPTQADISARLYASYSDKAAKALGRAVYYDALLVSNGAAPITESVKISITDLKTEPPYQSSSLR